MKKVTQKDLTIGLPTVLGGSAGAFASSALAPHLGKPAVANAPTQKELYMKAGLHLVIAGIAAYGYMAIDGKDALSEAGKGAALVIAAVNGVQTISTAISSVPAVKERLMADTSAMKVVRDGLGLACPCERTTVPRYMPQPQLNGYKRRRGMNYPAPVNGEVLFEQKSDGYLF